MPGIEHHRLAAVVPLLGGTARWRPRRGPWRPRHRRPCKADWRSGHAGGGALLRVRRRVGARADLRQARGANSLSSPASTQSRSASMPALPVGDERLGVFVGDLEAVGVHAAEVVAHPGGLRRTHDPALLVDPHCHRHVGHAIAGRQHVVLVDQAGMRRRRLRAPALLAPAAQPAQDVRALVEVLRADAVLDRGAAGGVERDRDHLEVLVPELAVDALPPGGSKLQPQ